MAKIEFLIAGYVRLELGEEYQEVLVEILILAFKKGDRRCQIHRPAQTQRDPPERPRYPTKTIVCQQPIPCAHAFEVPASDGRKNRRGAIDRSEKIGDEFRKRSRQKAFPLACKKMVEEEVRKNPAVASEWVADPADTL